MIKSDFHVHTSFCDGADSPEAVVEAAIELGIKRLGFSSHSPMPFPVADSYAMTEYDETEYKRCILSLKAKYFGKIDIFLGIELDYFSQTDTSDYDYVIGSVHFVQKNGEFVPVDESPDMILDAVKKHYNGDIYGLTDDYYRLVGGLYRKTACDIIGHFDLPSKFNENNRLFDSSSKCYQNAAIRAAKELAAEDVLFEVNTGAIGRGYRSLPYPEPSIFEAISAAGGRFVLSSDSHSKHGLLFGFELAERYVRQSGAELVDFIPKPRKSPVQG